MPKPSIRRQDPYLPLSKEAFRERFFARFYDPEFEHVAVELERVFEVAWDGYSTYRKSPRQVPAGAEFNDPGQQLPAEWLATRAALVAAEARHRDPSTASVILVGTCTRCTHLLRYRSNLLWTDGLAAAPAPAQPVQVLIQCDCGLLHTGRDSSDEQGCGAYWYYEEPKLP